MTSCITVKSLNLYDNILVMIRSKINTQCCPIMPIIIGLSVPSRISWHTTSNSISFQCKTKRCAIGINWLIVLIEDGKFHTSTTIMTGFENRKVAEKKNRGLCSVYRDAILNIFSTITINIVSQSNGIRHSIWYFVKSSY